MKKAITLVLALAFTLTATVALAEKAPQPVSAETLEVLQALQNPDVRDTTAKLFEKGNIVTGAKIQLVSRQKTKYAITVQQCIAGGRCFGGAEMLVERTYGGSVGGPTSFIYKAELRNIRSIR